MDLEEKQGLKVGDKAPNFSLQNQDGNIITLADFKGQKLVLYFYPRDNTPGCTKEACAFRDAISEFNVIKSQIIGISTDDVESHKKFAIKFELNFSLLADVETKVSQAYGVWKEKNNYGKKYFGIVRSTFVIDENGVISHIFRNVKVEGHKDQVLAALAK